MHHKNPIFFLLFLPLHTTITLLFSIPLSLFLPLFFLLLSNSSKHKMHHKNPIFLLLLILTLNSPSSTNQLSSLDPKQLLALQSLGLAADPCRNATACDNSSPFRHVVSLSLSNCPPSLSLSLSALSSLHTLLSLSFLDCPLNPPIKILPFSLSSSLRSFSSLSSSPFPLSPSLLPHLHNLTSLLIKNTPFPPHSPPPPSLFDVFSQMRNLSVATISNTTLSGELPRHWHSFALTRLDLSSNKLKGPIFASIGLLESLEFLNVSSNELSGPLPDAVGQLMFLKTASFARNSLSGGIPDAIADIPELALLDLSYNRFNGTIPGFLSEMRMLRHLNLEGNDFRGVVPFNESFVRGLEVFRVGGNGNLCYNKSVLPEKLVVGILPCDKYGLPVQPPPGKEDKDDSFADYDYGGEEDGGEKDGGGGGHHEVNKLVLGVAIGLSCLFFLVIFLVCVSKFWG